MFWDMDARAGSSAALFAVFEQLKKAWIKGGWSWDSRFSCVASSFNVELEAEARAVVLRFWKPQLDMLELAAPDAKSLLQEWAQGRRLPLPRYLEVAREGPDHAPRFTAEVQIDGVAPERGTGANKRAAEQAAALAMLVREGVWQAPPDV